MATGHELARYGTTLIADTNTYTATSNNLEAYGWIFFIEDTTFNAATTAKYGDSPSTSKTYTAGSVLPGTFSVIKLATGSCHAVNIPDFETYF